MKDLHYKSLQPQKVCKESQKIIYFKEKYIKICKYNYSKYSGSCCVN